MSAQHGSVSPSSLHDTHLADRQSAADVIRNGSVPTSQYSIEAIGNNADASLQVDARKADYLEKRRSTSYEEVVQRGRVTAQATQAYLDKFEKLGDCPTSPSTQALKDDRDRKLAAEKLKGEKEKERLPEPPNNTVEGQRVLREAFCINRLDSIRQMVRQRSQYP